MAATTITVPTATAERLRLYKGGRKTYADVLEDLMDAVPPSEFLRWAEKELARNAVPYRQIRRSLLGKN